VVRHGGVRENDTGTGWWGVQVTIWELFARLVARGCGVWVSSGRGVLREDVVRVMLIAQNQESGRVGP
jgi:hypothetical protein